MPLPRPPLPPILDCHVHWRDPRVNSYEALSDAVAADGARSGTAAQVYLPEDYHRDAMPATIAGYVHIEAEWEKSNPIAETIWLHQVIAPALPADQSLAVVRFCDLSFPDAETVLAGHAAWPLTRGVRHILNHLPGRPDLCWAPRDYLDDAQWRRNYARLAAHGLDFDLMCFGHQLAPFAALAANHPDIPVHLEHAALPWEHSPTGRAAWRDGMRALAQLPRADVKISGLGNTIANWTCALIEDYVLETIEIFGVDRCSFASNFPTDRQFSDMNAIWSAFDTITAGFSAKDRLALFQGNARRAYRI